MAQVTGSDINEVLTKPAVDVVLAGRVLGISRKAAYRAAKDGSLPSFKIGSQYRVPTAKLREMLGLPVFAQPAPIAA